MVHVDPLRPRQLNRISDRLTFLYLEHCILRRDGGAVTATDKRGTIHIPAATMGTLLLGPGTSITHQAVSALADSGCAVAWVGEQGVRFYAGGAGLTRSDRFAVAQAKKVSNVNLRLDVVRRMYAQRFPHEEGIMSMTTQQLRGREGVRIRRLYRQMAEK